MRFAIPLLLGLIVWGAYAFGRQSVTLPVSVSQRQGDSGSSASRDATEASAQPLPGPERAKAMEKVAEALRARANGKLDDAMLLSRGAKDIDPKLSGVLLFQARIALAQRDVSQADTLLLKSIRNGEDVVECLNLRGSLLATQKAFREAYSCFEDAAAREPLNAYVYFYWGEALRQEGRSVAGTEKLQMADWLATEQSDLFVIRAKLLLSQIEVDDVQGEFADSIRERVREEGAPGEWVLAAAGLALKEDRNEDAAKLLLAAREALQPNFYNFLIADPFFGFYRSRPAVKALLVPQAGPASETSVGS